jgi:hypothetical protein
MRHSILREGVIAGVIGATSVALWFLVIDTIGGRPFLTPITLGRGLVNFFGAGAGSDVGQVALYTLFHYAAFILVGFIAVAIVHIAERQPAILAGALMLFVAFEIGFYALSSALAVLPNFNGPMSWVAVAVGNLVAAVTMGIYLWKTHPALGRGLAYALSGQEPPD